MTYNLRMHPPRLFCPQLAVGEVTLDKAEARHALRSLRLRAGDAVTLFDGRGGLAHATLAAPSDQAKTKGARKRANQTAVTVIGIERVPPQQRTLTLVVAGCKGPRLDWLIEKCTELGTTRIVLAEFARSVVNVSTSHLDKLRRSAIEACKQCGRTWLPELEAGLDLTAAISQNQPDTLLVAHPTDDAAPLGEFLRRQPTPTGETTAVIGPEGGLTPEELDLLADRGAVSVRLGNHILRTETAAVAVAAGWAAHAVSR